MSLWHLHWETVNWAARSDYGAMQSVDEAAQSVNEAAQLVNEAAQFVD
jgi:hypothetical protein